MNKMATNLEQQLSVVQAEKTQLATILAGMVEGVLVTDAREIITLINPAFSEMMALKIDCIGKSVLDCIRSRPLYESIQTALATGKPQEKTFSLQAGEEERHFMLHTTPLLTTLGPKGSVSVFYDVTHLRKLENIRRDFVANVSHELKTPLTNILGYAETLRMGAIDDKITAVRFVEKIENNALQLKNLVEDILKLSEIESGTVELTTSLISLDEMAGKLQTNLEDKLKAKQLSLSNLIPMGLQVRGDPNALQQILKNLIDNAIQYTPEGGKIILSAESSGHFCKITVADSGIGIDPKDLPHLFERFYRVDKARSRHLGGTGLGLAIVKHYVQAHGGEVGVTSEPGLGSQFFFTIPLK